jgi:hypothetical protein
VTARAISATFGYVAPICAASAAAAAWSSSGESSKSSCVKPSTGLPRRWSAWCVNSIEKPASRKIPITVEMARHRRSRL